MVSFWTRKLKTLSLWSEIINKMQSWKLLVYLAFYLILTFGLGSCALNEESDSSSSSKYLYVSAGLCYSGAGNTTFTNLTASNLVYRINLQTGARDQILADYNASPAQVGDSPVGLGKNSDGRLYVLVENNTAGARRIESIDVKTKARSLFSNNTTALSAVLRSLKLLPSGDLLVSKSTAIEKISASNVRITKGANPYVSAPAAPCATATTLISQVSTLSNDFIVFLHAAASQNRIGFVKASGYGTAGDCSPAQTAPVATAFPTAMAFDEANSKLIVAYAGNTLGTDINSIYAYDLTLTDTSVSVGTAHKIYDASLYPTTYPYLLYGVSAMELDPTTNTLYIATATTTATTVANYAIEKFSYNPSLLGTANTQVLNRVNGPSFYEYGVDTKCISDLLIAD